MIFCMRYYSTNNPTLRVSCREAVLSGLAPDGGLYMPESVPSGTDAFFEFFSQDVTREVFDEILRDAVNFPIPLVKLTDRISVLELFHGPTLAFKDVGARFMARLLAYFIAQTKKEVTILVATSGDTGSAVAHGFFNVPHVRVVILYPSGKVSEIQEKQLTTMGGNITAMEVSGVFDDCQRLVKQAFLDVELSQRLGLTSANSINIARWIPQATYYFSAFTQLSTSSFASTIISVPSGNFGNLAAGLLAKRMGLAVNRFVAATNVNDVVPEYLRTAIFSPRASVPTISNAMDVGNPSNLSRIMQLYPNIEDLRRDVVGISVSDQQTRSTISSVYDELGYVLDPHGAVGYTALIQELERNPEAQGIFFATAHPAKFLDVVESCIGRSAEIPERLAVCLQKQKQAIACSTDFSAFKKRLLNLSIH